MSENRDFKYALIQREYFSNYRDAMPDSVYQKLVNDDTFFCLACAEGFSVLGLLVFKAGKTTCFINWVWVNDSDRRIGIGTGLIYETMKICHDVGLEVATFAIKECEGSSELVSFIESCGFIHEEDTHNHFFRLSDTFRIIKRASKKKLNPKIKRLEQVRLSTITAFDKKLQRENRYYYFMSDVIDRRISCVYVENDVILGCCLIGAKNNNLEIEYCDTSDIPGNKLALFEMACECIRLAAEEYPPETKISVATMNEASFNIINKLVGDSMKTQTVHRYLAILLSPEELAALEDEDDSEETEASEEK